MKTRITIAENMPSLPGEKKVKKVMVFFINLTDYQIIKIFQQVNEHLELIAIDLTNRFNDSSFYFKISQFYLVEELKAILDYFNTEYPSVNSIKNINDYWDVTKSNSNENN